MVKGLYKRHGSETGALRVKLFTRTSGLSVMMRERFSSATSPMALSPKLIFDSSRKFKEKYWS